MKTCLTVILFNLMTLFGMTQILTPSYEEKCFDKIVKYSAFEELKTANQCISFNLVNRGYLNDNQEYETIANVSYNGKSIVFENELISVYNVDSIQVTALHEDEKLIFKYVDKKENAVYPEEYSFQSVLDSARRKFDLVKFQESKSAISWALQMKEDAFENVELLKVESNVNLKYNTVTYSKMIYKDPETDLVMKEYILNKFHDGQCHSQVTLNTLLKKYSDYNIINLTQKKLQ
ncbi:hypothetical protein [Salibacter halophilus]|uniref:Uncharacterized protein n=1 Tax=Salibacter halophilus TaxID=1803916 RepID=A0A6N6M7J3_9FLAO|nr:hypothetical protein [Salibacter halophilus]KAB1065894.1 hypothetical protein F3059_00025 [Salibacter halophilus]